MTKRQSQKKKLYRRQLAFTRQFLLTAEDRAWLDAAPIGQEFGSPDFKRLETLEKSHAAFLVDVSAGFAEAKQGKHRAYRFGPT